MKTSMPVSLTTLGKIDKFVERGKTSNLSQNENDNRVHRVKKINLQLKTFLSGRIKEQTAPFVKSPEHLRKKEYLIFTNFPENLQREHSSTHYIYSD